VHLIRAALAAAAAAAGSSFDSRRRMNTHAHSLRLPRVEVFLAFTFGIVFCGILAYAGLRTTPISDPGQFFFLRVHAAISAAGVAAVIPGMLQIEIGQGKLFVLRGAGALAVFAIVYLVNPPDLIHSATQSQRAAMEGAYGNGQYEDALRYADDILKGNPEDAETLNIEAVSLSTMVIIPRR
jgi:hypothetical protein